MKRLLIISTSLISIASITTALAINAIPSGAEEVSPIQIQVSEHEGRIDTLEADVDTVKNEVNDTKSEVQNIKTVQVQNTERITTIENKPAPAQQSVAQPNTVQVHAPEPVTDPMKIVSVTNRFATTDKGYGAKICTFTLYNGEVWWVATVSPYIKNDGRKCQYQDEKIMTPAMKINLTNRPYDLPF